MQHKIYEIPTLIKEHTKHALNPRKSFGTVSIDIVSQQYLTIITTITSEEDSSNYFEIKVIKIVTSIKSLCNM